MPPNEQYPIKDTHENSFFDSLRKTAEKLSPEYQRWKILLKNTGKTIAEATEQQSLATLLAARTTGRYALFAGTTAAIAAGFVWYEQRKLDGQTEELNKKQTQIEAAAKALAFEEVEKKEFIEKLINASAGREAFYAALQTSRETIKTYYKGENTACFQKYDQSINEIIAKKKTEQQETLRKIYGISHK